MLAFPSSWPTGWKKEQRLALPRTLLNSPLSSLLPSLQLLLFPKWLSLKKKKSLDAFCVCEFHVDCFHVAIIHVSVSAVSIADALGSLAAGTKSTSGARSGYHQPLAPGSCLVFFTFFFHNYIFLSTLFLSPHHPGIGSRKELEAI